MPFWFKLFVPLLVGLVITRLAGVRVFLEITYDGLPFLASLTDARNYFASLCLILVYILLASAWRKLSGHGDKD